MKRILLLLTIPALLMASDINGVIKDRLDKTPLDDAIVKLVKLPESEIIKTIITDEKGEYFIGDVASGVYQIEVSKPDYYKNVLFDFTVEPQRNYECNIDLLQRIDCRRGQRKGQRRGKEDDSEYCFMIGSIEVKSHGEELIPEEAVTTRKISSGEIEHMQATSLGDVLNLVPGIEKTQNPGLSSASRVGVRSVSLDGTAGLLESYGTTIIVDNNELSTMGDATSAGQTGVDLRTIPADNIESVEVISGIPSAAYGNFSNGLIKVKTKSGYMVNKLKAKLNPDTKTASYSGGHKFTKSFIDYHFNYGYSERDLRDKGDEYQRLYGKLSFNKTFLDEKLNTVSFITMTKVLDSDEATGAYHMRDYTEGYKTSASFAFDYNKSKSENFEGNISLNLDRQKDFKEKFVADQVYIPANAPVEYRGDMISDTLLAGYIGSQEIRGYSVDINSNLKYTKNIQTKNYHHKLITGFNGKYDTNIGDGYILDDMFNYYGLLSPKRSYAYDEYDGLHQYSLFGEDNIKGTLFSKKYNMMLGLRYTVFNPKGFDFSKGIIDAQHGEFLVPRFNFQYFLSDKFRFRIGAGQSVKAVSLSYIHKEPYYYSWLNSDTVWVNEKHLQENLDLTAYKTTKYEASVDWSPSDLLGFSLTGYYSTYDNSPSSRSYPIGYSINPDTLIDADYSVYENIGWKDNYGTELMIRTKRFKNLQFKMNVTYRKIESGRKKTIYDSDPNLDIGETTWFKTSTYWREKVILDYQINYVSQRLGAWVTLDIQQIPLENDKEIYHSISYPKELNGVEYTWHQGQVYWYDPLIVEKDNKVLFNLRITKSLSQKTEFSLYVNNLFDDRAIWVNPYTKRSSERNPQIYYGLEVSTQW